MQTALVVVRPFGRYAVGDVITDAEESRKVTLGEHSDNVVSVQHALLPGTDPAVDAAAEG